MFLPKYINEVGMATDYPKFEGHSFFDETVSTVDLFLSQYTNNEFNAVDIVVKYLAIEEYYGKNNYGFEMYRKMQMKRVGEDWNERFKQLIKSFESGIDMKLWIEVDLNYSIHDGAHRLALAIYHECPNIPIRVFNVDVIRRTYNLKWFVDSGFSNNELNIIQDKLMELLNKTRKEYYCVLWPPARKYYWDILQDLPKSEIGINIKTTRYIDIPKSEFKKIIYQIYETDDILNYKLDLKYDRILQSMNKEMYNPDSYGVLIVKFTMDNPDFRLKPITGLPQSRTTMRIKKAIREDYRKYITSYYHDIIIHITDNQIQNNDVEKIIKNLLKGV